MKIIILKVALYFFEKLHQYFSINLSVAHKIYVRLYCITGSEIDKDLERLKSKNISSIKALIENGYQKINKKLDERSINNLHKLAATASVIDDKGQETFFKKDNINSILYKYKRVDLINNETVQSICCNKEILDVVRNYFGQEPYFEMAEMFWSTTYSKKPSKDAAQWFHFDLDRVSWLKVFVYLTDVGIENGPHCYIEGSHKMGSKPYKLLKRGYVRISDKEISDFYGPKKIKLMTGKKGDIFIGNTKAWHKGTNLKEGNRLVLQLQYTNSFFLLDPDKYEIQIKNQNLKKYLNINPSFLKGRKII